MPKISPYEYLSNLRRPERVRNMILESLHQGLDGWTEEEQKIIHTYLQDICMALEIENPQGITGPYMTRNR